jgi:hypothetical protein
MQAPIPANGPAIWGGCVTRRSTGHWSRFFSLKILPVQGGYGACFCCHGIRFIACWRGRGTSFISGWLFLQVDKLCKRQWRSGRGRNLSRSQEAVRVQDFNYLQLSVSGCNNHY